MAKHLESIVYSCHLPPLSPSHSLCGSSTWASSPTTPLESVVSGSPVISMLLGSQQGWLRLPSWKVTSSWHLGHYTLPAFCLPDHFFSYMNYEILGSPRVQFSTSSILYLHLVPWLFFYECQINISKLSSELYLVYYQPIWHPLWCPLLVELSPKKIFWNLKLLYLWIWPYLKIGSLQLSNQDVVIMD